MFKPKHSYIDFLEGVLIGGSLGAAGLFLFGTQKGKKLQKKAMQHYHALEKKAHHYRDNLERAMKSPAAKKLKQLTKKVVTPKRKAIKKSAARRSSRRAISK